jgi:GT2 family glycosyltransferase
MKNQTPLSVVIPVYNGFELLEPVLEELLRQRIEQPCELVLVDDGSDPPLRPWLEARFADAELTLVEPGRNQGRGAAVNAGIREARGEVVAVLDADVVPQPKFLAEHLGFHVANPEPHQTLLGAMEWAAEPSLLADLLGPRSNPDMREHFGDVPWSLWFTDNWSFKRAEFLRLDEWYPTDMTAWGWEELDLTHRLYTRGMRCRSTGQAGGLHLKQRGFEEVLNLFERSVPNLRAFVERNPENVQILEWLNQSYATPNGLAAIRDCFTQAWRRIEAWQAEGHALNSCPQRHREGFAEQLNILTFALGIAQGLQNQPGITVGTPMDTRHLDRLAWFVGHAMGWVREADPGSPVIGELRDLTEWYLKRAGVDADAADDFRQQLEEASRIPGEERSGGALRLGSNATAEAIEPVFSGEGSGLELSVIVPTYGRPERVQKLLAKLAEQDLDAQRFEVIVVDDGTPEPVRLRGGDYPFSLLLLRQENGGPGSARNTALAHARGPLSLILNDDSLPAPDLLSGHLAAHAEHGPGRAILGAFPFAAEARRSPFTQTLEDSDLLFDYVGLRHRKAHRWTYFWTCNISLSTETLRAVGGFDAERFREAIVEDVELGYRLAQRGVDIVYRADLICEHDHTLTVDGYFARAKRLGVNLARMYGKHGDPDMIWSPQETPLRHYLLQCQATIERLQTVYNTGLESLRRLERGDLGPRPRPEELAAARDLIRRLSMVPFCRGLLEEFEGADPWEALESPGPQGQRVSIVVVSHNALDQTRRSLAALRASLPQGLQVDLHYVDNGSVDGTPEYLAAQPDVRLIRNPHNVGAPLARNQALREVEGDYVVVMDNDVIVPKGWLERLLWHADADARSGCIGCLADRAGQGAQIDYGGTSDPAQIAAFADALAKENAHKWRHKGLLSSFLLLMRREVLDQLGGFDGTFSPWGFEDDDFTLRAHLLGYRNRLALDVFVRHEAYDGPKAEHHDQLLAQNWQRFAAKWAFADAPRYGDYSGLAALERQDWTSEELYVQPLAAPEARFDSPHLPSAPHVLAWPDYSDEAALRALLEDVAEELIDSADRQLVLRLDPRIDGDVEQVVAAIESAYTAVFTPNQNLNVHLLDEADPGAAVGLAKSACGAARLTGSDPLRREWLESCGLASS